MRHRRSLWLACLLSACGARTGLPLPHDLPPPPVDTSVPDTGGPLELRFVDVPDVDLVFVVDDSASMAQEQAKLRAQFPLMVRALVTGDVDPTTPEAEYPPIESLRVAVLSTDMGVAGVGTTPDTADSAIGSCGYGGPAAIDVARLRYGDDGRYQLEEHSARVLDRLELDCDTTPRDGIDDSITASALPTYLGFMSATGTPPAPAAVTEYVRRVGCFTNLGVQGCAMEQPLESMLKALTPAAETASLVDGPFFQFPGDTGRSTGHGSTDDPFNGGFLREDSLLAVVVVTDEDDCSSADPKLFDYKSTEPGFDDPFDINQLNTRCARHPELLRSTERFVRGLLARRPGREGMVVFGAITGVPPELVDGVGPLGEGEGTANIPEILASPSMQLALLSAERPIGPGGAPVDVPASSVRLVCGHTTPSSRFDAAVALTSGVRDVVVAAAPPNASSFVSTVRASHGDGTNFLFNAFVVTSPQPLEPGVSVRGLGVAPGTLANMVAGDVSTTGPFALRLSEPAVGIANDSPYTLGETRGPAVGQMVTGDGIAAGTVVTDVSGTGPYAVSLSIAPIRSGASTLSFGNPDVMAVPAQRIAEVAEGLHQAGANVSLQSICADDFRPAMARILTLIQSNLSTTCLRDPLPRGTDDLLPCSLTVTLPPNGACADTPGLGSAALRRVPTSSPTDADGLLEVCAVEQVPVRPEDIASGSPPTVAAGWFYDDYTDGLVHCARPQRISFTARAQPPRGSSFDLWCAP